MYPLCSLLACLLAGVIAITGYMRPLFVISPGWTILALCLVPGVYSSRHAVRLWLAACMTAMIVGMFIGDRIGHWWIALLPAGLLSVGVWRIGRPAPAIFTGLILFAVCLVPFSNWLSPNFIGSYFDGSGIR
jgi:hypothetical protein